MPDSTGRLLASQDTIVAIATPLGRSGIGLIRVSGPQARAVLDGLFRSRDDYSPRKARFGTFCRPDGSPLDKVVITVFEAPRSYTGEDMAEIGAHGNPLILKEIEECLVSGGARRARRGEFTLRAVANGKIDLVQAEAVRDFIEAETAAQASTALRQMGGSVSGRVRPLRDRLVAIVAELEASIDFSEDEPTRPAAELLASNLEVLASELEALVGTFDYGKLLTGGVLIAIVGRPNVGKSSLFNRLVASDRAIVTEVPGTTRDVLTETVELAGVPVRLADTAGVHDTSDLVERLGVGRALETSADADLTILVLDGSRALQDQDRDLLTRLSGAGPLLIAINKSDQPHEWEPSGATAAGIRVSALTGEGSSLLSQRIEDWITGQRPPEIEDWVLTSARHKEALGAAAGQTRSAISALGQGDPDEMILVALYDALSAIGEVTGEVTSEDILDKIFSSFCIGK